MRRFFYSLVGFLWVVLWAVPAAHAATLEFTSSPTPASQAEPGPRGAAGQFTPVVVTVKGTAEAASTLSVYAVRGSACLATLAEIQGRAAVNQNRTTSEIVQLRKFDVRPGVVTELPVPLDDTLLIGSWVFCAYLSADAGGVPELAATSAPFEILTGFAACPTNTAFTIDSIRDIDGGVHTFINLPGPGTVTVVTAGVPNGTNSNFLGAGGLQPASTRVTNEIVGDLLFNRDVTLSVTVTYVAQIGSPGAAERCRDANGIQVGGVASETHSFTGKVVTRAAQKPKMCDLGIGPTVGPNGPCTPVSSTLGQLQTERRLVFPAATFSQNGSVTVKLYAAKATAPAGKLGKLIGTVTKKVKQGKATKLTVRISWAGIDVLARFDRFPRLTAKTTFKPKRGRPIVTKTDVPVTLTQE